MSEEKNNLRPYFATVDKKMDRNNKAYSYVSLSFNQEAAKALMVELAQQIETGGSVRVGLNLFETNETNRRIPTQRDATVFVAPIKSAKTGYQKPSTEGTEATEGKESVI